MIAVLTATTATQHMMTADVAPAGEMVVAVLVFVAVMIVGRALVLTVQRVNRRRRELARLRAFHTVR